MKDTIKKALKEKGFKMIDLAVLLNPDKPTKYAQHRLSLLVNGHRTASIKEIKIISEFTGLQLCELI